MIPPGDRRQVIGFGRENLPQRLGQTRGRRRLDAGLAQPKAQRVADLPVSQEERREAILRKMADLQSELDDIDARP